MSVLPHNIPLPSELSESAPKDYTSGMHAGLYYCRFVKGWHDNDGKTLLFSSYTAGFGNQKKVKSPATEWVRQLDGKKVGNDQMLKAASLRHANLLADISGQFIVAKTDWHFVAGMGNNHPVGNGFAWHPTLGVPYLTGAAVKGLLRAWCEQWHQMDRDTKRRWFGPSLDELNPKKDSNIQKQNPTVGELIFFDALPLSSVTLKADVMTPHYGKWYEKGAEAETDINVPADWHSPVPVPFLVVDKNQQFMFSVACRPTAETGKIDLNSVVKELGAALENMGAGAKTATGYGFMSEDAGSSDRLEQSLSRLRKEENEACRENQRIAKMSPFEKNIEARKAQYKNKPYHLGLLDDLKKGVWSSPEEQRQVAGIVKEKFIADKVWVPRVYEGKDRKKKNSSERSLALLAFGVDKSIS